MLLIIVNILCQNNVAMSMFALAVQTNRRGTCLLVQWKLAILHHR